MPADRLEFSLGEKRGKRQKVVVRRFSGTKTIAETSQYFESDKHFHDAAKVLKVGFAQLQAFFLNEYRNGKTTLDLNSKATQPNANAVYFLRGLRSAKGQAETFATFQDALAQSAKSGDSAELVIEWESKEQCCALDLDFHNKSAPSTHELTCAANVLQPVPAYWWVSKHGGLKAVYFATDRNTADELAAVASLALMTRFPLAAVELCNRTRTPTGEYHEQLQTSETNSLASLEGRFTTEDAAVNEWLEARGFERGCRYTHDRCPVLPSARAAGNADPVIVYDDHVFCHVCKADGVMHGSRTPGYFSFASLCGTRVNTLIKQCAENYTHWTHARYILCKTIPNESIAQTVYRALLKVKHGDDERIPLVFSAAYKSGLLRFNGYWVNGCGQSLDPGKISAILASLPAAKYRDDEGQLKASNEIVQWLSQPTGLAEHGYAALTPVWGIQLTQMQDLPPERVYAVLHTASLAAESMAEKRPRYLPAGRRMREDHAWETIERACPKINRNAVKLLIAAKGCAEFCAGLPPMIFFEGPTGSGKTLSAELAAAICGDAAGVVRHSPNEERLLDAVRTTRDSGTFAIFDEYLKAAKQNNQSSTTAMEIVLGLTPSTRSHKLYTGSIPLGQLPVCIWADSQVPPDVIRHGQIARRLIHVRLASGHKYEHTLREAGINAPSMLRVNGSREFIDAANTLLSAVIDEFFPPGGPSDFEDIAAALGFRKLGANDIAEENYGAVIAFFDCICNAPSLAGNEASRWPGKGWKLVSIGREDRLSDLWQLLCDPDNPTVSRILAECDLEAVCKLAEPAKCDIRSHGNKVVIRFLSIDKQRINGELRHANPVELEPVPADPNGLGDAERSQLASNWFAGIPSRFVN